MKPGVARRAAWLALLIAVAALHLFVTTWLQMNMIGFADAQAMPKRLRAAFVRELQPTDPPPAPVTRPVARKKKRTTAAPPPVESAASSPQAERDEQLAQAAAQPEIAQAAPSESAASDPVRSDVAADDELASTAGSEDAAAALRAAVSDAVADAAAAAASAAAPTFEWPPSTRLSYSLTGYFRGDVNGSAQVEWIRSGLQYQVHLDLIVGPTWAPLLSRRMTSEGTLGDDGLTPSRYVEETKVALRGPRHLTLLFEPDTIVMPDGTRRERRPGVQDAASQFVQLTWSFLTHRRRLEVGGLIEFPLALPRSIDDWQYDVVGEEMLATPAGEISAWHLKPRRISRAGGDLTAEMWFAPSLQYLPVRVRIRQDEATWVELLIERLPQQALSQQR